MLQTKHSVLILGMDHQFLRLEIDGNTLELPWKDLSPLLAGAAQSAREKIEISPAGYGLHWPLVDEDLSINGILRDFAPKAQSQE